MPRTIAELTSMLQERRDYFQERNSRYDILVNAWHGNYQKLYPAEFPSDEMAKIANFLKLAADSYAAMIGKVPDKIVRPRELTDRSQKRASKIEQIASAYDQGSNIKLLHYMHGWYLCMFGASCRGVVPDFANMRPRFVLEDPRNVYPEPSFEATYATRGENRSVLATGYNSENLDLRGARGGVKEAFYGGGLEDVMIEKRASIASLKSAFPDKAAMLGDNDPKTLRRIVPVVQYFSRTEIVTFVLGKQQGQHVELSRAYHDLGFCPFRLTQTFAPDQVGGISQFEEQIPLIVAHSRILSQKLTFNDRTVWPLTWVSGDIDKVHIGPHEILRLTQGSSMGQLPPPTEFQADRDLATLDGMIRALNREGDPLRAEVSGGPVTGRGLEQLLRPINTVVEHYWSLDSPDTEALYSYALAMDEAFWPDTPKKAVGRLRGEDYEVDYTPATDIKGHREVAISYGFGVGGTEGFIQMLQALGSRLIDKRTVMEAMPGVRSVNDTLRKVDLDRLDDSIYAAFDAGDIPRAQFLSAARDEVAKGKPLTEVVRNLPPPQPVEAQAPGAGGGLGALLGPESQAAALEAGGTAEAPALAGLLQQVGG